MLDQHTQPHMQMNLSIANMLEVYIYGYTQIIYIYIWMWVLVQRIWLCVISIYSDATLIIYIMMVSNEQNTKA